MSRRLGSADFCSLVFSACCCLCIFALLPLIFCSACLPCCFLPLHFCSAFFLARAFLSCIFSHTPLHLGTHEPVAVRKLKDIPWWVFCLVRRSCSQNFAVAGVASRGVTMRFCLPLHFCLTFWVMRNGKKH